MKSYRGQNSDREAVLTANWITVLLAKDYRLHHRLVHSGAMYGVKHRTQPPMPVD